MFKGNINLEVKRRVQRPGQFLFSKKVGGNLFNDFLMGEFSERRHIDQATRAFQRDEANFFIFRHDPQRGGDVCFGLEIPVDVLDVNDDGAIFPNRQANGF